MIVSQIILKIIAYFIVGRLIIELLDATGIINLVQNQLLREFQIIIYSMFVPVIIIYCTLMGITNKIIYICIFINKKSKNHEK